MRKISLYRAQIMGFAILWIMLFHSQINIKMREGNLLYSFFELGFLGVDIFILLSGFGIYFSLEKTRDTSDFYYRRFLRVMPSYFVALLVYRIIETVKLGKFQCFSFLQEFTTLGFWGAMFNWSDPYWYVSAIVFLYIIAPFIYTQINNKNVIISIIVLSLLFCSINDFKIHGYYNYLFARIPVFIIGLYWGKEYHLKKKSIMMTPLIASLMCMGGGIIIIMFTKLGLYDDLLKYSIIFYLFITIIPSCLILVVKLCESFSFLSVFFCFFGKMSLELYLAHGFLFRLIKLFDVELTSIVLIVMFMLAIPLGFLISKTSKVVNICRK